MRLCRRVSDNRILEMQSGSGDCSALLSNAIGAGYTSQEIYTQELEDSDALTQMNEQAYNEAPYWAKRKIEYPNIGNQLDAILKQFALESDGLNTDLESIISEWQAVKARYPKPQ